jgi:hypothetical protein
MPGFLKRLSAGLERASQHLSLALVPILFALMDTNKILAVTSFDGGHIGFKLGLPLSVVTVWQFVSLPNSGVAVDTGLPVELLPLAVVTVPVLLVVQSALAAGYFGSIRNALDDKPHQFVASARRYFLPFLVLTVLPVLVLLPLALGVFGVGALGGGLGGAAVLVVLPALIVFLVAAYLFYATPYLVVLRDAGVVDAARQSYALATRGGPYAAFAAGFALFVLAVSPVATGLVVNLPVVGLPVGILGGSYLGLAANVATMRFLADLDPGASVAVSWEPSETPA